MKCEDGEQLLTDGYLDEYGFLVECPSCHADGKEVETGEETRDGLGYLCRCNACHKVYKIPFI